MASAHAAIVRDGIGALSLRGLCDEAGFSQGAFYSNFASRDALLVALMERHIHGEVEVLQRLVGATRARSLDDLLTVLAEHLADLAKETQWSQLAVELQLHAQRDPGFASVYNAAMVGYHAKFAALVDDILHHHKFAPTMPSLQIAIGLYALWSGLSVQGGVPGARPRDEIFLAFLRAVIGGPIAIEPPRTIILEGGDTEPAVNG